MNTTSPDEGCVVREWQAIPRNSKFWRNFWKICLWLERKLQMWGKTFDAFFFDQNYKNPDVWIIYISLYKYCHRIFCSSVPFWYLIPPSGVSFTIFFFCFRRRWFPIAALSVFPAAHNHEITKACSFKLTTYKSFSNWENH